MTLSYIAASHICVDCMGDNPNPDCGGSGCRLKLLEAEERAMIEEDEEN